LASDSPDLTEYIPRCIEILTCFRQGDYEMGQDIIREYSIFECRNLLATMAAIAAGLLSAAYSDTDLTEDEWMPHFGSGLVGMFLNDDEQ
jgi:hypothetical protein